jgi:hypothetical protein
VTRQVDERAPTAVGVASAEGKWTEDFLRNLWIENSLNLRFGFPRVKRHFSYEGNEQIHHSTTTLHHHPQNVDPSPISVLTAVSFQPTLSRPKTL